MVCLDTVKGDLMEYDFNKKVKLKLDKDTLKRFAENYNYENSRNIFITGATGFLGVYLIRKLMVYTDSILHCLVRSEEEETGLRRFLKRYEKFFQWNTSYNDRLYVYPGNLDCINMGIEREKYKYLARNIDTIYHNAALVTESIPYEQLEKTNVNGTHEIIRFAGCQRKKFVHYISTYNVFMNRESFEPYKNTNDMFMETEKTAKSVGLIGHYGQTKWVSEEIIKAAMKIGMPANIFRLGRISGDSKNKKIRKNDLFSTFINACIDLGKAPKTKEVIGLTPVDIASDSIYQLSRNLENVGEVFHISNPNTISWDKLIGELNAIGYRIDLVSYGQWLDWLGRSKNNRLSSMMDLLTSKTDDSTYKYEYIASCKQANRFATVKTDKRLKKIRYPESADLVRFYFGAK